MFEQVSKELKNHIPFTAFGVVTGIVIMTFFQKVSSADAYKTFYILHPLHVVLSALVTASIYKLHACGHGKHVKGKCNLWILLVVGYVGSIGIATISDSLIPYLGETLLHMPNRGIHIGFIEKWWLVNPLAIVGVAIAYFRPSTKFPHAGHVLLSTWASLFHIIMAIGESLSWLSYIIIFIFLFLAVWVPCCASDIVFPLLFVRKKRRAVSSFGSGGYGIKLTNYQLPVILIISGFFVTMTAKFVYAGESNTFTYGESVISDCTSSSVYVYGSEEEELKEQAKLEALEKAKEKIMAKRANRDNSEIDKSEQVKQRQKHKAAVVTNEGEGKEGKAAELVRNLWENVIGVRAGYISGDTKYHIRFSDGIYTGESELGFPMDNWMVGGYLFLANRPLRLALDAEIWSTIENDAGDDMADKDWINDFMFSSTESNVEMKGLIWDVNLRYDFYRKSINKLNKKAGFLLGYKRERFDFEVYGIRDVLWGTNLQHYDGVKVLEYQVKYMLPYIGLISAYTKEKWGLEMRVKYSPYAMAEDFDDHLLRGKTTRIDAYGDAWILDLKGFWKLPRNWELSCGGNYTVIETDGTQVQRWYRDEQYGDDLVVPEGTEITDIDADISSDQWIVWSGARYEF